MASIAEMLGVDWAGGSSSGAYRLTGHAAKQAAAKGFSHEDILSAANDPEIVSDNGRYPGQKRHVRGNIVAVVDPIRQHVITAYVNVERTAPRADQTDQDAQRYSRQFAKVPPQRGNR